MAMAVKHEIFDYYDTNCPGTIFDCSAKSALSICDITVIEVDF